MPLLSLVCPRGEEAVNVQLWWRLSDNHSNGKQAEGLVDNGRGVVQAIEQAWVLDELRGCRVEVPAKYTIVLGAELFENLRVGLQEQPDVLRTAPD